MLLFIYICILALNAVAVILTYHFLGNESTKKERWIFIAVGIAILYLLVSIVYGISTNGVDLGANAETGKNLIVFTFVPVNGMVILPFLAHSYRHWKLGDLKTEPFRNRCILLAVILLVLLVFEFFYFKDIQNGILTMIQNSQK